MPDHDFLKRNKNGKNLAWPISYLRSCWAHAGGATRNGSITSTRRNRQAQTILLNLSYGGDRLYILQPSSKLEQCSVRPDTPPSLIFSAQMPQTSPIESSSEEFRVALDSARFVATSGSTLINPFFYFPFLTR
jgi:hypothetical protein